MTIEEIRNIVADHVGKTHGNEEFIRQIRDGLQDDGPFMQAAKAVYEAYEAKLHPEQVTA